MISFKPFRGMVTMISDFFVGQNGEEDCYQLMTVEDRSGAIVNFVISPVTYFVDQAVVMMGDQITGYYDENAPVPFIFPPQYRALIIVKDTPSQNVKVDYFNSQLISSDGLLKLNPSPYTQTLLTNGQPLLKNPANRNLIAIYGSSTKSIPAQTVPYKIIVWCSR